jgi:hypothetical protein
MRLSELLSASPPDIAAIARYLDELSPQHRMAQVLALTRPQQACLFRAAEGWRPLTCEDLVPSSVRPMVGVAHEGRNSLPAFQRFAKVFCRPRPESHPALSPAEQLWGYNRNPLLVTAAVGPGYFVAYPHERDGEYLIDYLRVPPEQPDSWPPIVDNRYRLSRFVYNGTQDVLRGVSTHVSIGRAMKRGRYLPNWFVLCRAY